MHKYLVDFITYANSILKNDQFPALVDDKSVKHLTENALEINELTPEDITKLISFESDSDVGKVIYLYSVLLSIIKNDFCFKKHAEYIYINRECFGLDTQYFLYSQVLAKAFIDDYDIPEYMSDWMFEISSYYVEHLSNDLTEIVYKDREQGLVLVITSQFLGPGHSPSELVLNVCYGLIKSGKRVFLINLADVLSITGMIPYLGRRANYYREYLKREYLSYKDVDFPFFQCEEGMPDIEMMHALLSEIRLMKPEIIISIGEDIFSNVVDDMIPVCSLPLESGLCKNFTKYIVHYNSISKEEHKWATENGYTKKNLIRMSMPYQIIQSEGVERQDIGIPQDAFCLLLIGNRLEQELSDAFLEMLNRTLSDPRVVLLIIGKLDCEKIFERYSSIRNSFFHIERTEKLLAVCRIVDLYVNPPRRGGGTSAIYAMAAGKPIITLNFGDVYNNCGDDFMVEAVQEIEELIRRYIVDKNFYKEKSDKAILKAKIYEDSSDSISNLILTLEAREGITNLYY